MARLIELLFFAIILYMVLRRMALPFRRGYNERERERSQEQQSRGSGGPRPQSRIDKSSVKDAEFKEIDDVNCAL